MSFSTKLLLQISQNPNAKCKVILSLELNLELIIVSTLSSKPILAISVLTNSSLNSSAILLLIKSIFLCKLNIGNSCLTKPVA